jgi:hypothetical protein
MLMNTPAIVGLALAIIAGQQARPPNPACPIKGTIDAHGVHVFLSPGSPGYPNRKIDKSRGERWFCTEAAARAAGWLPAPTPTAPKTPAAPATPVAPTP